MSGSVVEKIVAALRADEVVLIPTDTVYGLAANPQSTVAMQRLFTLKERPEGVPVAVLVASTEQALEHIEANDVILGLAVKYWPGALTIVGQKRTESPLEIGGDGGTVGVRCPNYAMLREVAAQFGPFAATSANRHGEPTLTRAAEARASFPEIAESVDGGVLGGQASTVVDVTDGALKVLRQGAVHMGNTS